MAGPDAVDRFYRVVRGLARFWLWFLFKSVVVRHPERVPDHGPVLLCVNHPNNLIDSLVVGVAMRRKVHYMATATLFRNRLLARFLRACGAIPVYRREEGPAGPVGVDRNVEAFAACHEAFAHGRMVAIYPEGTTHAEARVQRIRTGAARIALGYEAERPGALRMIPVGLSFQARKSFRGRVLIAFGEPIAPAAYVKAWREDPVKAVDALTQDLQAAMELQVVNVERIDDQRLVGAVEELYRDELAVQVMESRGLADRDVDPVRLSRSIADAVRHFKRAE
ncbi:MAG TPA: lysophospholipid acyltransferase family protein, partial [Methylomirabilota bacterium]|nr:lysophospholipid acyltransferase family protein [Methylomirabilota bacterium]